jgi:hypothetical protein
MPREAMGWWLLAGLLATLAVRPAAAQSGDDPAFAPNEPAADAKRGKVVRAWRLTGAAPRIDGLLDDEAWVRADIVEGMIQTDPDNLQPMTERTRMQVAYDDHFLYIALRCDDGTPDRIVGGLGRRDEPPPSDLIGIGFDPRHDHQTAYVFQTNPSGVQSDFYFYNDDSVDRDFDAVWEVRTGAGADGWTAEFRIPFSQMRFTASLQPGQVWGFGVRRAIQRKSEVGDWTAFPRGERGIVSRWGHLVFDAPLGPPRRVEWQPYVRAGVTKLPQFTADAKAGIGLDARVGIGTAATLSATVNPDFGQVEQDPAVLNLTVFETFFPEKRPFFLEDSRTFVPPYGIFQLFHSRRIGRRPGRLGLPAGDTEVDRPDDTTIVGAVKLTGKRANWTYGALTAITAPEHATVDALGGGTTEPVRLDRLVEPTTSYNVVRLQRDVRRGSSNVGVIATSVVREGDQDAFAGGGDFNLRWDRNRVSWNGHWVGTHAPVAGIMKTGVGGVTNVNFGRKHFGAYGHLDHFGEDFRIDDLGFFRSRADRTGFDGGFEIAQPDPWRAFNRIGVSMNAGRAWNSDGVVFGRFVGVHGFSQLKSFWNVSAGFVRDLEALDDLDTRGGPPIVLPSRTSTSLSVATDNRKSWRVLLNAYVQTDAVDGWDVKVGPGLNLKPSDRLQASISTSYNAGRSIAQWIRNQDVTGDGVADHVYGTLDRDVVDVTVRSTFAVHRDMTLQLFLQPFVAVGAYTDIRRLARPSSYDFEAATLADNPDFNRKSLRGNLVLRWEFVRGSTLFVAWNMATSDTSRAGEFEPLRDLRSAFGGAGTHALLVKATYWLSR